jgi:hypothetical protein
MGIRLKPEAKAEFHRLFVDAVRLQTQLYNVLGEIEGIDGVGLLHGLDDAVRGEASNWDCSLPEAMSDIDVATVNAVLSSVEREK